MTHAHSNIQLRDNSLPDHPQGHPTDPQEAMAAALKLVKSKNTKGLEAAMSGKMGFAVKQALQKIQQDANEGKGLPNAPQEQQQPNGPQNGVNGPQGGVNGPQNGVNGPQGGLNGPQNGVNGPQGGLNGPQNGVNGPQNGVNGPQVDVNGPQNGVNGPQNGVNGPQNGVNGPQNGVNGPQNGANGPQEQGQGDEQNAQNGQQDGQQNGQQNAQNGQQDGVNGPQTNGPQTNGPQGVNGPQTNGPQTNGPQTNGPQTNGPQGVNGPQTNGPQMGGGGGGSADVASEWALHEAWGGSNIGKAGNFDQYGGSFSGERWKALAQGAGIGAAEGLAQGLGAVAVSAGIKLLEQTGSKTIPFIGSIIAGAGSAYGLATFDYGDYASRISGIGDRWEDDPWGAIADTFRVIADTLGILGNVVNVVAGVCGIAGLICLIPPLTPAVPVLLKIALTLGAVNAVLTLAQTGFSFLAAACRALSILTMDGDARQIEKAMADLRSEMAGGVAGTVGFMGDKKLNSRDTPTGTALKNDGITAPEMKNFVPGLGGLADQGGTGNPAGNTIVALIQGALTGGGKTDPASHAQRVADWNAADAKMGSGGWSAAQQRGGGNLAALPAPPHKGDELLGKVEQLKGLVGQEGALKAQIPEFQKVQQQAQQQANQGVLAHNSGQNMLNQMKRADGELNKKQQSVTKAKAKSNEVQGKKDASTEQSGQSGDGMASLRRFVGIVNKWPGFLTPSKMKNAVKKANEALGMGDPGAQAKGTNAQQQAGDSRINQSQQAIDNSRTTQNSVNQDAQNWVSQGKQAQNQALQLNQQAMAQEQQQKQALKQVEAQRKKIEADLERAKQALEAWSRQHAQVAAGNDQIAKDVLKGDTKYTGGGGGGQGAQNGVNGQQNGVNGQQNGQQNGTQGGFGGGSFGGGGSTGRTTTGGGGNTTTTGGGGGGLTPEQQQMSDSMGKSNMDEMNKLNEGKVSATTGVWYAHNYEAEHKDKFKEEWRDGYAPEAYFEKTGSYRFELKQGQKASAAINAFFKGLTICECLSAIVAIEYKTLLKTVGAKKFDAHFGGGQGGAGRMRIEAGMGADNPLQQYMKRTEGAVQGEEGEKDKRPVKEGQWHYFYNHPKYLLKHPGGAYQGENCFAMGKNDKGKQLWRGMGVDSVTEDELLKVMAQDYSRKRDANDERAMRHAVKRDAKLTEFFRIDDNKLKDKITPKDIISHPAFTSPVDGVTRKGGFVAGAGMELDAQAVSDMANG